VIEHVQRSRVLALLFLATVAVFAGLGLRGRLDEVATALGRTTPHGVVASLGLVVLGLLATARVWLLVMARLGAPPPRTGGTAVFFVGQLGKYVPGSVWAIGTQAQLARRFGIDRRATVTAGLVFLGYNVVTATALAAAASLAGALETPWGPWAAAFLVVLSLAAASPLLVNLAGTRVAGRRLAVTWADTLLVLGLLTITWTTYAGALLALSPDPRPGDLVAFGGAFAASYAVGVLVVLAPAGLGAREATLVLLLTPSIGVGEAAALALLARVVHTLADASLAAGWWLAAREHRTQENPA